MELLIAIAIFIAGMFVGAWASKTLDRWDREIQAKSASVLSERRACHSVNARKCDDPDCPCRKSSVMGNA